MHECSSEFDALADLFLGDGVLAATGTAPERARPSPITETPHAPTLRLAGDDRPASNAGHAPHIPHAAVPVPPAAATLIEGVLVGHLPVLGGVWVTQYAKHVAERDHAPVALLRIQAGHVSIDVVTPRNAPPHSSSRIGEMHAAGLEDAIRSARSRCTRWLVRVDEASEADLVALNAVTSVALLTGADDPAVVASYRTIKSLQQAGESHDDRETPQGLSIAIMGADDERASAAEAKLRRAASSFLGRSLEHAARVAKIGACTTTNLFRGESPRSIAELIALVDGPGAAAPNAPAAQASPDTASSPASPESAATPGRPIASKAHGVPGEVEIKASPKPATSNTTRGTAAPGPAMAGAIPGLAPLPFRCPYAPAVELALGPGGGLHLVATLTGEGEAIGPASLLTAASWAQSHASLLEAARPDEVNMNHPDGPVLHVITTDARLARPMLDTGVRVHLVVRLGDTVAVHDLN